MESPSDPHGDGRRNDLHQEHRLIRDPMDYADVVRDRILEVSE
jgi:hypothetical protein